MPAIVLVGHRHSCPIHGEGTVTSGSAGVMVNGRAAARIGDDTSCGATITTGSASTFGGAGIAYVGCQTSHGGSLPEGDESWQVAP
ncbi:PAAR domain-containing protein [Dyella sp. ASV21]|jgi:uncharacterized Zn-binding protein involved in type VI secretion|uniref:PAAR domain-containing protein n=1 Tax=Dyella sp. ASV21 TaxID=2795114 RepID=UPI0018ECF68C|nr:PAAR domain-containing protein [Dyella sp. ASV21]